MKLIPLPINKLNFSQQWQIQGMRYRYLISPPASDIRLIMPSPVSVSILGNGRLREFLMRVDINAQWEKEERAIITKLDKFDAWPGLDCIYVTNKLSLLQAPSAGSRAAGAQYWRGDCRTSGAGARGQHPGNENNQETTPGLQLRQLQ